MQIPSEFYGALSGLVAKSAAKESVSAYFYPLEQKNYILKGNRFSAGFASAEVMPKDLNKKSYMLAGYKTGNKITGVIDTITVSAMWIDCGTGSGIIMVSADLIGLTGADVSDIRNHLKDFCTTSDCKEIIISCTHTHASPDTVGYWGKLPITGKNKQYMLMLKAAIKSVCINAYNSRRPGKIYSGSINVPEMAKSGRKPYLFDDRLSRIRFVPDDGTNEIWYVNYCAHPNTLGAENSKISADYPCYMRRKIKQETNADVLFSIGATAAVDIKDFISDRYTRTLEAGKYLAEKAISIKDGKELTPEITLSVKPYVIPIENSVLYLMKMLKVVESRITKCDDSPLGTGLVSEIDYLRLGDLSVLTVPGEVFPEIVYKSENGLASIFGDEKLVVFGVTNDMTGYIVPEYDFVLDEKLPYLNCAKDEDGNNHYNETNSLGIGAEKALVNACKELIENLNKFRGGKNE